MIEDRPQAPEHIDGEAIVEWVRVCDELAAVKRLEKTDRAMLVLYVETWAVRKKAQQHVDEHGAVVKWPNGMPGRSPYYQVVAETTKQLHALLRDMGLTYASRPKTATPADEPLSF